MDLRLQEPPLRAAHRLADVEELIQPLIDALSANVAVLTLDASICAVNAAWRTFADLHGCKSEAYCVGMNYLEVCTKAQQPCPEAGAVATSLRSIMSGTTSSYCDHYVLGLADGLHHFKLTISRLGLLLRDYIVVCHEDVTAAIRLEEQRRSHAAELVEAQDRERSRIARELHDSTAQHLAAAGLLSQRVLHRSGDDEVRPLLQELSGIVAEAQTEIRTLSFLLHPPLLAELGLKTSLLRFVEGFSKRTGVEVAFRWELGPDERLGDCELAILRIAQEALANVHRHSGARNALVHVEATDEEVCLTVSDTGVGIGPQPADEGVGIPSMRSRVTDLGGALSITRDGDGTHLVATFPRT